MGVCVPCRDDNADAAETGAQYSLMLANLVRSRRQRLSGGTCARMRVTPVRVPPQCASVPLSKLGEQMPDILDKLQSEIGTHPQYAVHTI